MSTGKEHDAVRYAEFKVLLKPQELRRIVQAYELWQHVHQAVEQTGTKFTPQLGDPVIKQRDVLFYDTPDYDLYENHFILRRRTHYQDGWTHAHDELTFKFRHPDEKTVRAVDVHPGVPSPARVKFKREILPLRDEVGGVRHIYTRNCVMAMPPVDASVDMDALVHFFPALKAIEPKPGTRVALVNRVTVNETLTEFGVLDFGHGLEGTVSLALWRDTRSSAPVVGELGFQLKFDRLDEHTESRLTKIEEFFKLLQHFISRWLYLGATKTNLVYQRRGHEVHNRE